MGNWLRKIVGSETSCKVTMLVVTHMHGCEECEKIFSMCKKIAEDDDQVTVERVDINDDFVDKDGFVKDMPPPMIAFINSNNTFRTWMDNMNSENIQEAIAMNLGMAKLAAKPCRN